jgi:hypothetical protein
MHNKQRNQVNNDVKPMGIKLEIFASNLQICFLVLLFNFSQNVLMKWKTFINIVKAQEKLEW